MLYFSFKLVNLVSSRACNILLQNTNFFYRLQHHVLDYSPPEFRYLWSPRRCAPRSPLAMSSIAPTKNTRMKVTEAQRVARRVRSLALTEAISDLVQDHQSKAASVAATHGR